MARNNDHKTVDVPRKMDETPLRLDVMTNKYSEQRQIQLNETYARADEPEGTFHHGRKTVNINVIDLPAVVSMIAVLYEEETGKKLELE